MARVLTSNVSLAYSIEDSLGIPSDEWRLLEPNTIGAFGANITTVARNPISRNRQRRKGTVTDLDSSVEFEADLTLSAFRDFLEGFIFAIGVNGDVTNLASSAVAAANNEYTTVDALVAAQVDKLEVGTLLWASGFAIPDNNGLKSVDTDVAAGDTISVAEILTDESGASGLLSLAGYRIPAAGNPTWTYLGTQATLAGVAGIGMTLAALGLTVGQFVHIGSVANAGAALINGFEFAAANDMVGYARVRSISSNSVIFDKVSGDGDVLQRTSTAAGVVDILFGEFFRNVATDSSLFEEHSFQFEADFPDLRAVGVSEYQYALGNFCNTLGFNLPLTDKATLAFAFIGTDTENPTAARKVGADLAVSPEFAAAFNTSADIARIRITDVDEMGLTTDFKSLSLTFNNNVSPEKTVGRLGARYINAGNFLVDIESQLIFTNPDVVERIRSNARVTMDFIVRNENGVILVDIPSMTLGGGGREFPVDESVLINTTGEAYQDDLLGTSLGVSIIPVPIPPVE